MNVYTVTIKRTTEEYVDIEVEADDPQEAAETADDVAQNDEGGLKWQISELVTELHDITTEEGNSVKHLIKDDEED
jgi:hypothetical protein